MEFRDTCVIVFIIPKTVSIGNLLFKAFYSGFYYYSHTPDDSIGVFDQGLLMPHIYRYLSAQ